MKTNELFSEQELQAIADQTAVRLLNRKAHDYSAFRRYLYNVLDLILDDFYRDIYTHVVQDLVKAGQPLLANDLGASWVQFNSTMRKALALLKPLNQP